MTSSKIETDLRLQARRLLEKHLEGDRQSFYYLRLLSRYAHLSVDEVMKQVITIEDMQDALAVKRGYRDWLSLVETENLKTGTDTLPVPIVLERQLAEYEERGIIKFDGLISLSLIDRVREDIYLRLEKSGLWVNRKWNHQKKTSMKSALRGVNKSNIFQALITKQVLTVAKKLLLGEELIPASFPSLLFTPPYAEKWIVPSSVWHTDYPRLGKEGSPGTQMFTFLDYVKPGGGGTIQIAGSHHLLNEQGIIQSKSIKRLLSKEPFFQKLFDKNVLSRDSLSFFSGRSNNTLLEAVELTGKPGDVYFCDLRLLHTLAANTSHLPRMMMTQRMLRSSIVSILPSIYSCLLDKKLKRKSLNGQ